MALPVLISFVSPAFVCSTHDSITCNRSRF